MKTVTLDDEAYAILRGAKTSPDESFSEVVKRALGAAADFRRTAGAWKDMTEAEARKLRQESRRMFGTTQS